MIKIKINQGFTLIELIVVIAILSIILAGTITTLNPIQQINKAKVAQKQSDLEQIKTALDLYYDDNKCYPIPGDLPFGSTWQSENTVYMQKVPQSSDSNAPYFYDAEGACPQWYTLFARVDINTSGVSSKCALANDCMPPDDSNNHICVYGGIVDCNYINNLPLGDNN